MKVLTLKSAPIVVTPMPNDPSALIVSTMDKQILTFNMVSGHLVRKFKVMDGATSELAVISSMTVQIIDQQAFRAPVIIGVSSNDRSIRGKAKFSPPPSQVLENAESCLEQPRKRLHAA